MGLIKNENTPAKVTIDGLKKKPNNANLIIVKRLNCQN